MAFKSNVPADDDVVRIQHVLMDVHVNVTLVVNHPTSSATTPKNREILQLHN